MYSMSIVTLRLFLYTYILIIEQHDQDDGIAVDCDNNYKDSTGRCRPDDTYVLNTFKVNYLRHNTKGHIITSQAKAWNDTIRMVMWLELIVMPKVVTSRNSNVWWLTIVLSILQR